MNSLFRDILAGIFTIVLGFFVFFSIDHFSRLIRTIGETITNKYLNLNSKHLNRENVPFKLEETKDDRISNGLIKGIGLFFVVIGVLYLFSLIIP